LLSTVPPPSFETHFEDLAGGLSIAGDDAQAATSLRKRLWETYDIEVVDPPRKATN
jgi:hypothetical protein